MGKCITCVGLDVHKNSIAVAFADEGGGEVRPYGAINSDLASLANTLTLRFIKI
jgi:hypothetical protein